MRAVGPAGLTIANPVVLRRLPRLRWLGGGGKQQTDAEIAPLHSMYYGNPAARQASVSGAASAAGTAKPAQCRSIVKFGWSAKTRAAGAFASATRPCAARDAAKSMCIMLNPGFPWAAPRAAFAASW